MGSASGSPDSRCSNRGSEIYCLEWNTCIKHTEVENIAGSLEIEHWSMSGVMGGAS